MKKEQFVEALAKLRPSSTFLTLHGYRNAASEVADYSLVFHISYETALVRSIATMEAYEPTSDDEEDAKDELLSQFKNSLKKARTIAVEEIDDSYERFFDDAGYIKGIKMLKKTGELHLYGLVAHKKVLVPGFYDDKDTRRELTKIKDRLRRKCSVSKFRQFKMLPNQVDSIVVQNLTLLPPTE